MATAKQTFLSIALLAFTAQAAVDCARAEDQWPPATSQPDIAPLPQTPNSSTAAALASAESVPAQPAAGDESPLDKALRELEKSEPGGPAGESALDRAVRELTGGRSVENQGPPTPALATPSSASGGGEPKLRLLDISLDGLFAGGSSTERDPSLQSLQGGGHDPRKRGFTVQQVELSGQGAVDPYLDAALHSVWFLDPITGETVMELEECFATTRALPHNLQLKFGHFLTEFGRSNPTHPHAWAWAEQSIINTRVFGPDGMRAPGVRMSWILPVHWTSELYFSLQNANGETMGSFLANEEFFAERPIGNRPFIYRDVHSMGEMLYATRWENSWTTCCDQITWLLGASAALGPNCTGATGNTQIFGIDLTRKWKPEKNERGWPFTVWTTEFIVRRYEADPFANPNTGDLVPGERLVDAGFYTQLLYGFKPKWALGLRYEYVWGDGPSLDADYVPVSPAIDPFRDDRHRVSPLLAWYLTEFSRFRFQYNYDHAQHLERRDAHSFWLSAEFLIGSHPAHRF